MELLSSENIQYFHFSEYRVRQLVVSVPLVVHGLTFARSQILVDIIHISQAEKLPPIQSFLIFDFHLAIKQSVLNSNTIFPLSLSWHLHHDNQRVRIIWSYEISLTFSRKTDTEPYSEPQMSGRQHVLQIISYAPEHHL
jgi:hypothetical protein